jgi:uncharacterized protein YkwD
MGHTGSDGSSTLDRIKRYAEYDGFFAENISYGHDSGILDLYIDDETARQNITNPNYTTTGIAACSHKSKYRGMMVIVYAASIADK